MAGACENGVRAEPRAADGDELRASVGSDFSHAISRRSNPNPNSTTPTLHLSTLPFSPARRRPSSAPSLSASKEGLVRKTDCKVHAARRSRDAGGILIRGPAGLHVRTFML